MPGELLALLGSLLLAAACSGPPRGPGSDAWGRARGVAESYLRGKYGEPPAWTIDSELTGTPFLFKVHTPGEFAVLVHEDQVIEQRGLGALDRYLRQSRCVELRTSRIEELMVLLQLLDALPPYAKARNYFRLHSAVTVFRPRLDYLDGGRATLALYYRDESTGDAPRESGGDTDDDEGSVLEWMLAMNPGAQPVWTSRWRRYDRANKVFKDVDHPN